MDYEDIIERLWKYWEEHSKDLDYCGDGVYYLHLDDSIIMVCQWLPFCGIGHVNIVTLEIPEESDIPLYYITQIPMKADGFELQGENGWFYKSGSNLEIPGHENYFTRIKEITGVNISIAEETH